MQHETLSMTKKTHNMLRGSMLLAGFIGAGAILGFAGAEITEGPSVSSRVIACQDVVQSSNGQTLSAEEIAPCDDLHMVSARIETYHATEADLKEGREPSKLEESYRLVEPDVFDQYIAQRASALEQAAAQSRRNKIMLGLGVGLVPTIVTALYVAGRRPVARLFHVGSSHDENDQVNDTSAPQPTNPERVPAGQGAA